jgi:hypothetical protein
MAQANATLSDLTPHQQTQDMPGPSIRHGMARLDSEMTRGAPVRLFPELLERRCTQLAVMRSVLDIDMA